MITFSKWFLINNLKNIVLIIIIGLSLLVIGKEIIKSIENLQEEIKAYEAQSETNDFSTFTSIDNIDAIDILNTNDIDYVDSYQLSGDVILVPNSLNHYLEEHDIINEPLEDGDKFGTIEHEEEKISNAVYGWDIDTEFNNANEKVEDIDAIKRIYDLENDVVFIVQSPNDFYTTLNIDPHYLLTFKVYDYQNKYTDNLEKANDQLMRSIKYFSDSIYEYLNIKILMLLSSIIILTIVYCYYFIYTNLVDLVLFKIIHSFKNTIIILVTFMIVQLLVTLLTSVIVLGSLNVYLVVYVFIVNIICILITTILIYFNDYKILRSRQ